MKKKRATSTNLSAFLERDRLFGLQLLAETEPVASANNSPEPQITSTLAPPQKEKERQQVEKKDKKKDVIPVEEQDLRQLCPDLVPFAHLRVLRMHPQLRILLDKHPVPDSVAGSARDFSKSTSTTNNNPIASFFLNGFDALLSAIGSSSTASSVPEKLVKESASEKIDSTSRRKRDPSPSKKSSRSISPTSRAKQKQTQQQLQQQPIMLEPNKSNNESQSPKPTEATAPTPNNAKTESSADQDLSHIFDNEPPPLEFEIPSEFPSFQIKFSKPVPAPKYSLIEDSKINASGNSKGTVTNGEGFVSRWSRTLKLADHDEGDSEEDEIMNGKGVMHHFEFKENQYFRYIEPTEEDLNNLIEYDMDEQDKSWLSTQNALRHAHSSEPPIPPILFEFIMDRLEKEWFDAIKQVPKPRKDVEEPEDNNCAVCDDGECENSNAIVFCDGCNLAVHQDCYGVPFIPEGQWLCRRCMVSPDRPVMCALCPNETGALKQTTNNKWAHVACAQWIPEASFGNTIYMEPIDMRGIPPSRYKLTCFICGRRKGACIQCANKNCYASYHVTCAKKCRLYMKMGLEDVKSFCDKHSPKEYQAEVDVEKEIFQFRRANNINNSRFKSTPELEAELLLGLSNSHDSIGTPASSFHHSPSRSSSPTRQQESLYESSPRAKKRKSSTDTVTDIPSSPHHPKDAPERARDQEYKRLIAAPVIPLGLIRRVSNSIKGSSFIRGKNAFVEKCCRYWALKREGRRGAPLLKRLHLEPWTAATSLIQQDETLKTRRIEILRKLRNDLERVRILCELVKKRERERLKRSKTQLSILDLYLNPVTFLLRDVLDDVRRVEVKGLFEEPVDLEAVPDYLTVVETPMCFQVMEDKLFNNEYRSVQAFADDITLICKNAQIYNKPDTPWYRAAERLAARSQPILETIFQQESLLDIDKTTGCLLTNIPGDLFTWFDGSLEQVSAPRPASVDKNEADGSEASPSNASRASSKQEPAITPVPRESQEKRIPDKERVSPAANGSKLPEEAHHDSVKHSKADNDDDGLTPEQRQLIEDERLAKLLHEQQLLESPRHRRRIGSSPEKPDIDVVFHSSEFSAARDSSRRTFGRRQASIAPQTPDAKLTRVIKDSQSKAGKQNRKSAPLAFASIYLIEEKPNSGRRSSARGSSSRRKNILGEYPSIEDRDFELTKDIISKSRTAKRG